MKLTEKTEELFNAPWNLTTLNDGIFDVEGNLILELDNKKLLNQISHLPELYDTLMEAVNETCSQCNLDASECKMCIVKNWLKLLKKVEKGK